MIMFTQIVAAAMRVKTPTMDQGGRHDFTEIDAIGDEEGKMQRRQGPLHPFDTVKNLVQPVEENQAAKHHPHHELADIVQHALIDDLLRHRARQPFGFTNRSICSRSSAAIFVSVFWRMMYC